MLRSKRASTLGEDEALADGRQTVHDEKAMRTLWENPLLRCLQEALPSPLVKICKCLHFSLRYTTYTYWALFMQHFVGGWPCKEGSQQWYL